LCQFYWRTCFVLFFLLVVTLNSSMSVSLSVCLSVCLYACLYLCLYTCVCVCVCVFAAVNKALSTVKLDSQQWHITSTLQLTHGINRWPDLHLWPFDLDPVGHVNMKRHVIGCWQFVLDTVAAAGSSDDDGDDVFSVLLTSYSHRQIVAMLFMWRVKADRNDLEHWSVSSRFSSVVTCLLVFIWHYKLPCRTRIMTHVVLSQTPS